jgi:hypothetical protein
MKAWRVAALAGALLWGACSKESAPAQAPASKPAAPAPKAEKAAPAPAAEPEAAPQEEAKAERPQAAEPEQPSDAPPEFKIGQPRDQVMKLFGDCAERRAFRPAVPPDSLYVEIYQPKREERCLKRLGERRFTIRGDSLYEITPGLYAPPPKPRPRPKNRDL